MGKDIIMRHESHDSHAALSRPLSLAEVPPEGLDIQLVATEAERAALAELNGLPAILSLEATLRAKRWRGDGLDIEGEVRARIRQTCVVTLDEFESDVAEPLHLRFAPPQDAPRGRPHHDASGEEHAHDALGEDPPDPLIGGAADLGAVVSEFLTLALDPYPRKPGVEFVEPAPSAPDENVSPFAKLRAAVGNKTPADGN